MKASHVVAFTLAISVAGVAMAQGAQQKQQDLQGSEAAGQRNDAASMTAAQQAEYRSQYDAAKVTWAAMTPQEKSATLAAARTRKLSELTHVELVGQRNDMQRESAAQQGQSKAEANAAKTKWDALSPTDKKAVRQSAWSKRRAELTGMEAAGQRDESYPLPF